MFLVPPHCGIRSIPQPLGRPTATQEPSHGVGSLPNATLSSFVTGRDRPVRRWVRSAGPAA